MPKRGSCTAHCQQVSSQFVPSSWMRHIKSLNFNISFNKTLVCVTVQQNFSQDVKATQKSFEGVFSVLPNQIQYGQCYKQENLHWVSRSYVFAGCLYYRFTGFIQSSINAVICTRVSLLNQCLKLGWGKKKKVIKAQKRAMSHHQMLGPAHHNKI